MASQADLQSALAALKTTEWHSDPGESGDFTSQTITAEEAWLELKKLDFQEVDITITAILETTATKPSYIEIDNILYNEAVEEAIMRATAENIRKTPREIVDAIFDTLSKEFRKVAHLSDNICIEDIVIKHKEWQHSCIVRIIDTVEEDDKLSEIDRWFNAFDALYEELFTTGAGMFKGLIVAVSFISSLGLIMISSSFCWWRRYSSSTPRVIDDEIGISGCWWGLE